MQWKGDRAYEPRIKMSPVMFYRRFGGTYSLNLEGSRINKVGNLLQTERELSYSSTMKTMAVSSPETSVNLHDYTASCRSNPSVQSPL
jgi:hypothetical protein